MKKYLLMAALCFGMGLLSTSQAGDTAELDEAMTFDQFYEYKSLSKAGHLSMDNKKFVTAYTFFVAAGKSTHFAWVRARMFANAGFAMARAQHCTESISWYNAAIRVQAIAEAKASGGIKWAKVRKQTRLDIMWGLKDSSCAPEGN